MHKTRQTSLLDVWKKSTSKTTSETSTSEVEQPSDSDTQVSGFQLPIHHNKISVSLKPPKPVTRGGGIMRELLGDLFHPQTLVDPLFRDQMGYRLKESEVPEDDKELAQYCIYISAAVTTVNAIKFFESANYDYLCVKSTETEHRRDANPAISQVAVFLLVHHEEIDLEHPLRYEYAVRQDAKEDLFFRLTDEMCFALIDRPILSRLGLLVDHTWSEGTTCADLLRKVGYKDEPWCFVQVDTKLLPNCQSTCNKWVPLLSAYKTRAIDQEVPLLRCHETDSVYVYKREMME